MEQAWRDAQQRSTESRSQIMQIQQQIELEAAQQRNASNILNGLAVRRERLHQEKTGLNLPDNAYLVEATLQLDEKRAELEEATMLLDEAQDQQPRLEEERRAAQAAVNEESASNARLDARLGALKQLQERVQSQGKVQPWLNRHELDGLPRLWQKLHIEAGWETALESVLRERTSALELSNLDWAKAFFSDAPPAKLALFSASAASTGPVTESIQGLQPLQNLLLQNDPGIRQLMQDWLCNLYAAEDVEAAFAARDKLPAGASFVTRQGHLIGKSSVRFYAADSEQDGMLARQQEIDNLTRQVRAQYLLADAARNRSVQAEAALTQAVQRVQEYRLRATGLTQAVHALQIDVMKMSEVQARFNQRSGQIATDLAEIAAQETEQQQARAESEAKFEQLDGELAERQEAHEDGQTDYLHKEQQLNDARQRLRDLERSAQEIDYAEKSQRSKIDELRRNIETARQQVAQLTDSLEQGLQEQTGLEEQTAQTGLQTLLDQRTSQERALSDARHELDQLSQNLRQHEDARLQSERSLQPQRDRIMEWQLKEQAARLNQEQFAQQLIDAQADEVALSAKLHDDLRPSYLQGEVTRLGNAIIALGAVNLAALDELAVASERKNFLDAQNADLTEAIDTLQDAIHRIDKETRELLQDTFDKVNEHFAELFPILFGGGQARLVMTGDEILDAGVQVMAQPPGKKNATIHLLSGGEKALTATALVFSMFQLNPAPFCLLDEVDAPLDDSNTERLCNMVRRMAVKTQFLFISHNKIAMEMAQQLIGVTMQEQGVSRIVAVDMESALGFATDAQSA
ncbi:Chromosome partition protein smc [Oxalobacteraceae bacterium IMCC9480]|nr:Chromosome partition protein smc [Oxalobacteraceae bacterium IMCC9480]